MNAPLGIRRPPRVRCSPRRSDLSLACHPGCARSRRSTRRPSRARREDDGQEPDRVPRGQGPRRARRDAEGPAASIRTGGPPGPRLRGRAAAHRRGSDDLPALHRRLDDRADRTAEGDARPRDRHRLGIPGGRTGRVRRRGRYHRGRPGPGPSGRAFAPRPRLSQHPDSNRRRLSRLARARRRSTRSS